MLIGFLINQQYILVAIRQVFFGVSFVHIELYFGSYSYHIFISILGWVVFCVRAVLLTLVKWIACAFYIRF